MAGVLANITVEPCNVTWGTLDLGFLDGDIEVTTEEQGADITAHQEGTNVLDMIRTGKNVEVSLTLKEAAVAKLSELIKAGGTTATATAEVTSITCVADVAASLNNKYFFIYSALDAVKYHVWFNVATGGTDPAPSGSTGIEVAIASGATASAVATAVQGAIDALPAFGASVLGAVVTVTNAATGATTDASDVNAGFTISVTTQGIGAVVGWGKSKDFLSTADNAEKLVLHPVALSSSDLSKDLAFWKAYPLLNSIVFSGENPKTAAVSFRIFPDLTRQEAVRLFIIGDHR